MKRPPISFRHRVFHPLSIEHLENRSMLAADLVGEFADVTCKDVELDIPSAPLTEAEFVVGKDGKVFYERPVGELTELWWMEDGESPQKLLTTDGNIEVEYLYQSGDSEFLIYSLRNITTNDQSSGYQDGTTTLKSYDVANKRATDLFEVGIWTNDGFSETAVEIFETQDGLMVQRNEFGVDETHADFWLTNGLTAEKIGDLTFTGRFQKAIENVVEQNGNYLFDARWNPNRQAIWSLDPVARSLVNIYEFTHEPKGTNLTTRGPYGLTAVGDEVYFSADDGPMDFELWKTDGTTEGTVLVADINPTATGPDDAGRWPWVGGSAPHAITESAGSILFVADDGVNGNELWKTNGQPDGTSLVHDFSPGADSTSFYDIFDVAGRAIVFAEADDGVEIWTSDGSDEGTQLATTIEGNFGDKLIAAVSEDQLFFVFDDGVHGLEMWVTDGTADGTQLAADINPGDGSSDIRSLTKSDTQLRFLADDGDGDDIWTLVTGGTTVGETTGVAGDTNSDQVVDFLDFLRFNRRYGQEVEGGSSEGDFNADRVVDFKDFLLLSENFGKQ